MNRTVKKLGLAIALIAPAFLISTPATAFEIGEESEFYLCPTFTGSGCTSDFTQFTFNVDSVSQYTDVAGTSAGIDAGDTVIDFGTGEVTLFEPFDFGVTDTQAYGTDWILELAYDDLAATVFGVSDPIGTGSNDGDGVGEIGETIQVGAVFTGGSIDVYYSNSEGLTDVLVATFNVISGTGDIANVIINMEVDFSNSEDTALSQSLFFFADGTSWYDLWNAADPVTIEARLDTNIDPVAVQDCSNINGADGDFCRETSLDGSVRVKVPEPGTLALLGAGLIGFGVARKKTKA